MIHDLMFYFKECSTGNKFKIICENDMYYYMLTGRVRISEQQEHHKLLTTQKLHILRKFTGLNPAIDSIILKSTNKRSNKTIYQIFISSPCRKRIELSMFHKILHESILEIVDG